MSIDVGDIDGTTGAAIGTNSHAQTVTINLPLPPPPDTASNSERIRFVTLALMNLQAMFVADRNDREERQEGNDKQFSGINRRLDSLEELARNAAYQARTDRLLFGIGIGVLLLTEIGRRLGWW